MQKNYRFSKNQEGGVVLKPALSKLASDDAKVEILFILWHFLVVF